ncbi:MAG: hypothetical protein PUC79_07565 [Prevotellaceae bacterium]|nr:hypothetical protein [Prevotellaceae bacterium]
MDEKLTTSEIQPSERVLEFIRQLARTYRPKRLKDGMVIPLCLN